MAQEPSAVKPQPAVPPAPPPEHCPGTGSESAGAGAACAGCPNRPICAANAAARAGPDPDLAVVSRRLERVRHKLLVLSGKGGVGKSTFSAQLAFAFARDEETEVGVLDIDICGPSIPKIMGVEGETIHQSTTGWQPVSVQENLVAMSIGFMLPDPDDAVIWRGPKKNGLIKQFLKDVEWGSLDYLIVDTPPGTTDEHLSVVQYLKDSSVEGAVLVTSPQEVALQDVRKEIDFCRKVKLKIIGVVENMSGWECPNCHKMSDVFPPTTGGAKQMCEELGVPFLGSIPLDPRLGMSCDHGMSFLDEYPDSPTAAAYTRIVGAVRDSISGGR